MRNRVTLVILAAVAGGLLPWLGATLYGAASFVQIDQRNVFAPGSLEDALVIAAVFLLPALVWGAALSAIVPRPYSIQLAAFSGACGIAIWLAQFSSIGETTTTAVSSAALLTGVLGGAFFVRRWRA